MLFEKILTIIPTIKNKKLPGEQAHNLIMSSYFRQEIFQNYGHKNSYKESAVMALLYPGLKKEAKMVFILRKSYNGYHSGQIAFPGGKKEIEDFNLQQTALRETYEEIGVDPKEIEVVKPLSEVFIPVSNYLVKPFLAITDHTPKFIKDPVEVEDILELPFSKILNSDLYPLNKKYLNKDYLIYAFQIEEYQIWGATAMILAEIRTLFNHKF